MASERLVFLVPGFFGFTSVGAVSYFRDVERALGAALEQRGVQLLGKGGIEGVQLFGTVQRDLADEIISHIDQHLLVFHCSLLLS